MKLNLKVLMIFLFILASFIMNMPSFALETISFNKLKLGLVSVSISDADSGNDTTISFTGVNSAGEVVTLSIYINSFTVADLIAQKKPIKLRYLDPSLTDQSLYPEDIGIVTSFVAIAKDKNLQDLTSVGINEFTKILGSLKVVKVNKNETGTPESLTLLTNIRGQNYLFISEADGFATYPTKRFKISSRGRGNIPGP